MLHIQYVCERERGGGEGEREGGGREGGREGEREEGGERGWQRKQSCNKYSPRNVISLLFNDFQLSNHLQNVGRK